MSFTLIMYSIKNSYIAFLEKWFTSCYINIKKNMTNSTFVGSRPYFKEKNIGKLIYRYFCDLLVCVKQMVIGVCESNLKIIVSFSIATIGIMNSLLNN